jgi:SAM-dependent methyltransferase
MPMSETPSRLEWGSHEIIGPVHIYRERLMLAWLRRFVGVGTILDAGCGTGSLMIALAKKGFRVCGVERSANGLRWLVQKADKAGVLPDVATALLHFRPSFAGKYWSIWSTMQLQWLTSTGYSDQKACVSSRCQPIPSYGVSVTSTRAIAGGTPKRCCLACSNQRDFACSEWGTGASP